MKNHAHWESSLFELIRRTSVDLPADVEQALRRAGKGEKKGGRSRWVLDSILENIQRSRENDAPLCQDTGTLIFYFQVPVGFDTNTLVSATRIAVARATRLGYLRQNTIDALSGVPCETNVGAGSPVFYFEQCARTTVDVRLIMKGGGCENVGRQYSLPDTALGAGRDMEGVRRCVLHAVMAAQGNGCAPGILGVCIGGDRATGYEWSKSQFLRKLDDKASIKVLGRLEERLMKEARQLEIGPMGLGGNTTLLGVKIGAVSRVPASFFVTVSYMCWAFRRRGALLTAKGGFKKWLY
ncbi:MAG: fumarate hydratase [bacterium]